MSHEQLLLAIRFPSESCTLLDDSPTWLTHKLAKLRLACCILVCGCISLQRCLERMVPVVHVCYELLHASFCVMLVTPA